MVIAPIMLIDGSGSSPLDLTLAPVDVRQPTLPLSAYYTTYGSDQNAINAQINAWYDANNDKLIVAIYGASQALSFKYKIVQQNINFASINDTLTTNRTFTISGLTPGEKYKIKVQAFEFANGTGRFGNSIIKENILISKFERLAKITATSDPVQQDTKIEDMIFGIAKTETQVTETSTESSWATMDANEASTMRWQAIQEYYKPRYESNRSLATLTNSVKDANTYGVAYRETHGIKLTSPTNSNIGYYTFGTTLILDASVESTGESGGIGFFVNDFANTGYFIQVDSTKRSGDINSKRRVRLYRVSGQDKVFIADSQTIPENTLDIIYPGEPYKIDVKVKHNGSTALIDIYVNGFLISAEDETPLSPTNQIAMFSKIGTVFFDYFYAFDITENEYAEQGLYNIYTEGISKEILKFVLLDKVFSKKAKIYETPFNERGHFYDFGKIARELRKIEVSFPNAPAFPIKPSTGINEFVSVVGHKTDNFKSEVYVINNSGFFTPLSDGNVSLVIYGYNIYRSGSLEYKEEESNEFTKDEPVYFESDWIQNEEDVKNLATWLKEKWPKSNTIVDVKVFGGILLSVGDIVTINYPYQGLTTSQKFLVQSVNHSYSDGGIDTTLTCRSL